MSKPKESWPINSIVEIHWIDSASRGRWDYLDEYKKEHPCLCRTAGYLVVKDKKRIVVALSQGAGSGPNILDSIVIPRGCIKRIRKLS